MDEIKQWYKSIGRKILLIILGALGAYVFVKYLLPYTAPFIIAWVIASCLQIIVKWLHKRLQMKRGIGTMLSMVTVLSAMSWGVTMLGRKAVVLANNLYQQIPLYREEILETFNNISDKTRYLFSAMPFSSAISLEKIVDQLFQSVAGFLGAFVSKGSINVVAKLPNILFLMIIILLSIFFMTRDYDEIKIFIGAQIPESVRGKSKLLKEDLMSALGGYIRTQLILMFVTMTICVIGFLLLGVSNSLLLGLMIGIVDALPIFGSGLFLVPSSAYNLIIGNYSMATGLIGIYALIVIVRQTIEPRILSNQIGTNTLVTLMAMYIGFKALGVVGLIVGPVVVIVIQNLQKVGLLPKFKKPGNTQKADT